MSLANCVVPPPSASADDEQRGARETRCISRFVANRLVAGTTTSASARVQPQVGCRQQSKRCKSKQKKSHRRLKSMQAEDGAVVGGGGGGDDDDNDDDEGANVDVDDDEDGGCRVRAAAATMMALSSSGSSVERRLRALQTATSRFMAECERNSSRRCTSSSRSRAT